MSRLERLVILLETGSTQFIRNTAADQLSDLAKGHPEEILNLLGRVYPYLKNKKWETRVAAARAFGGIVNHSELWDPNANETNETTTEPDIKPKIEELDVDMPDYDAIKKEEEEDLKFQKEELELFDNDSHLVAFSQWELQEILKSGKKLLANGGADYDELDSQIGDPLERLKRQKNNINARLGMGIGIDADILETADTDVKPVVKAEVASIPSPTLAPASPVESDTPMSKSSSARLKAMARRKAKIDAKNQSHTIRPVDLSQSSVSRQLVHEGVTDTASPSSTPNIDITSQQGGEKLVVEHKTPEVPPLLAHHAKVAGFVWPFQGVYELLILDLFSEAWEIRHGAALGLRELMRTQGKGAGRIKTATKAQNDVKNSKTLEDLAVRICTLFALDRFGDYVSDTVVAPVRESSAQTLAALLIHLSDEVVLRTFDALTKLVLQNPEKLGLQVPCWEASHGGMLGLRYFVSVRTDILFHRPELFDKVVQIVLHGLQESDDDVQAVAASTLTPIAADFVKLKGSVIQTIISAIWDCLTNLKDDLSASIGSVMDLLAKLCSHVEVLEVMKTRADEDDDSSFKSLVPRLFPFLRHSITKVRKAVLTTLIAFISIDDASAKAWVDGKSLRLLFQNLLVEQNTEVLQLSVQVYEKLMAEVRASPVLDMATLFAPHAQPLLNLLMTPLGVARHSYPMNTAYIMRPSGITYSPLKEDDPDAEGSADKESGRRGRKRKTPPSPEPAIVVENDNKVNIDAPIFKGDVTLVGVEVFVRTKIASATEFGRTLAFFPPEELVTVFGLLAQYLAAPHSTPRILSALIIEEYCRALGEQGLSPPALASDAFLELLNTVLATPEALPYYRELVPTLKGVRTQCLQLFSTFIESGKVQPARLPMLPVVVQGELEAGPSAFSIESAEKVIGDTFTKLVASLSPTYRMASKQLLDDCKHRISLAIEDAKVAQTERTNGILASYAAAYVALNGLPKKLNPIIRSLMESVKCETLHLFQERSANAVANLNVELIKAGKSNIADKIVKNLCGFLCVDTSEVPEFAPNKEFSDEILSLRKEEAKTDPVDIARHEREVLFARIKRNGGKLALESILKYYGSELFDKVPRLKDAMLGPLALLQNQTFATLKEDDLKGQTVVDSLGILRALIPKIDSLLHGEITAKLPEMLTGLRSDFSVFRYSTAKCVATLCATIPSRVFPFLVNSIIPMLNNAGEVKERQGAIECVYHLSSIMGAAILPYVVFLIVPVMGRMSDSDKDVRILASTTFASIIKLVPLEAGIPDPPDMPEDLMVDRDKEREFIQQMMDPTKIKLFDLPVTIKATLRKYQQEGVNWLAFLNKYRLHGILCDDMGLGKTLQTICIVSSDHHIRAEEYAKTLSVEFRKVPSLVICPPSLTGHWEQELNQYAPFLQVLVYAGGPSIRSSLRDAVTSADVVVTSYDVARNDIEFIKKHDFNYCVLDEGHIIKNAAAKLTKAVKMVKADHRLILSGTPIQNNVLELWSLFDFLMPGFLGTEKSFQEKFAKPIAASRNSKTSSKEQEAGALALESLHKQVLPFMLRRLKEDVLSDLPPKIIQDYYCELSELQKKLYKDFARKQKATVEEEVNTEETEGKTHIFQALQYMRKLCNHPALVMSSKHPQYTQVNQYLKETKMSIRDIRHAPKLTSLQTLLLECGIGVEEKKGQLSVISQHRALIFCQLKDMLDMVENDLFKKHMPNVTYMRLDGSTDPRQRQDIVRQFNGDPSIDVLLLTTKVGGLGLNLTGADTVIFVEHDWNPMNDLQAMDRAHRLGQKKVVNVYRLITKDTLEEKIMGLQKFKMNIASTIVNQQNAGLASMDTNQLLDLFDVDEGSGLVEGNAEEKDGVEDTGLTGKAGAAVGELAELWDESQYEEEYNLDNFIKTLH
ncbi:hypothetical protein BABINDRAFT_164345 [Babjeviella inositovora NRRL Y-12698]|uniref:TATA-binding protein-associated factor mot1 n=1 Tax=Babjeviella inositovora NRRL Y-12698 TaxID=984486 RepID=A0A1E3QZR6_9ASCO|nr:uncharacterized protein BABINDRAFT_164345 [Babjeviella inositovora NRRL Y-12698]ODQ82572.1 hypothetical protein BABINDRAFT_164345 [Babjeviella inositovora NRRL Y-12698]